MNNSYLLPCDACNIWNIHNIQDKRKARLILLTERKGVNSRKTHLCNIGMLSKLLVILEPAENGYLVGIVGGKV